MDLIIFETTGIKYYEFVYSGLSYRARQAHLFYAALY